MLRLFIFCFLALSLPTIVFAQTDYNITAIPKTLQAYANAVVRQQETSTEVKTLDQVIYKHKEVITILNGNGAEYAGIHVYYDKARQIKNLRAAIYDASGKLIKKVNAAEFQDVSAISDFSLFEDDRVKFYTPLVSYYPYTVEYEYEIRIKHTFYFPAWAPQKAADIAVQSSSHRFISKPDYQIRLKEFNVTQPKTEKVLNGTKVTEWTAQHIPALKSEPYSPPAQDYLTLVEIAPVTFAYEGIAGKFTNWQEYGQWAYDNMIKGRDELPAETVVHIKQLIKDISEPKEKVKKIYEYSQQKNRYISVQIGIGGLQPMPAAEVDKLGYGDCKALTNYTKALLKIAEIPAIYTEVNAGKAKKSYQPDFASAFQGNHAILCVPLAQDTIWLECTSREAPMGYLGSFTDDRQVLLCTEKGGIIARTRKYAPEQNKQIRTGHFILEGNGKISGAIETKFEGTQYDNRESILVKSPKDRISALKEIYPINNLEIIKYDLAQHKTEKPATIEKLELKAEQFGTLNNNMLLVPLNHLNRETNIPKEVRNRKNKVRIVRGFYDEDKISYDLPADYRPDYIPQPVELNSEFGSFLAKSSLEGNQLVFSRQLTLKQGEFSPETYDQLVSFLKKVADADRSQFVLVKK